MGAGVQRWWRPEDGRDAEGLHASVPAGRNIALSNADPVEVRFAHWCIYERGEPLTPELLEAAAERMRADHGAPAVEYHHPLCPKITSGGRLACRCGAAPLEALLEDDLEGRR